MYVNTFVGNELRTTREVRSDAGLPGSIHDARQAAMQVVQRLQHGGWKLEQAAPGLWLGSTPKHVVAAIHVGGKPERFAIADERMKREAKKVQRK